MTTTTRGPARDLVLAIDQGGHASRAIAFDLEGRVVARASIEVAETRIDEDRVEQDPDEIVRSIESALATMFSEPELVPARILRAGLATQRSSIVAWDRESGRALSPVLSWQDRRAHAWLEQFAARADEVRGRTGLRLSPHYGASKIRWCLDHLPAVAAAAAAGRLACGPLASFLAFRLCREHPFVADPANASRTLLFGLDSLDWDPVLLELFGVPRAVLPRCVPTDARHGTLADGGGEIALEILTGDQSAAIFAWGMPREDTLYVNLGTGAFVQRPSANVPHGSPRLLASLVAHVAGRPIYAVEGTVNGAGSALRAYAASIGVEGFERELAHALDGTREPPLYLNGVSGLGAPYWVPDFRSRFVGPGDERAKLAAVGESIVFLVRAIEDEIAASLPGPARILASGGLATVEGLCQRLADLTRKPVERATESEATSKGLATLLGVRVSSELGVVFEPRANEALEQRYLRFRAEIQRAIAS